MFKSMSRSDCDHERRWIGKANIFTGEYDHSAHDESGIFARLEHSCQIVSRRLWIATAQTFDECTDHVVMIIAAISQGTGSESSLNMFDEYLVWMRKCGRYFERGQRLSTVSPRSFGQQINCIGG